MLNFVLVVGMTIAIKGFNEIMLKGRAEFMNTKIVLIVDEDGQRAEKIDFIIRLGGYETRRFDNEAAALNWVKYGCTDVAVLCLLFNNPGAFDRAEQIIATWVATGRIVPVVLIKRGQCSLNHLRTIGSQDHFFACEPESVMQTLDILTAIDYSGGACVALPKKSPVRGQGARR